MLNMTLTACQHCLDLTHGFFAENALHKAVLCLQEHPGQVLTTHFGRYRDFGLYTDSLAFYGSRMFYYVWDLPIFVAMGAVGGLMGALFIKVNVKITQFRHLYIPVRWVASFDW